jgi:hypothetical protein
MANVGLQQLENLAEAAELGRLRQAIEHVSVRHTASEDSVRPAEANFEPGWS